MMTLLSLVPIVVFGLLVIANGAVVRAHLLVRSSCTAPRYAAFAVLGALTVALNFGALLLYALQVVAWVKFGMTDLEMTTGRVAADLIYQDVMDALALVWVPSFASVPSVALVFRVFRRMNERPNIVLE